MLEERDSGGAAMFLLYNGLLLLPRLAAAPLGAWLKRCEGGAATEWAQRLGYHAEALSPSGVWIQAASVGEVRVASNLVNALLARCPGLPLILTTTTRTGQALARSAFASLAVRCGYFPLDFPPSVRRALAAARPRLLVLVETEIWPNLLRECARRGVRTAVVNGRLSARSMRRYRLVAPLMRRALGYLDLACVQTAEDGERFAELGLPPSRLRVMGSMKYDLPSPPDAKDAAAFRSSLGLQDDEFLIVAGSTAAGEDRIVLDAFEAVRHRHARARLLLAPRHPERFATAATEAARRGLAVERRTRRRSAREPAAFSEVLILDTLGELPVAYAAAQAAFVGGSLVPAGGQNVLEPAACGLAPIFGPHVENFREPASRLLSAGAAVRVEGAGGLASALFSVIEDPQLARAAGGRGRRAGAAGAGATQRSLRAIEEILGGGPEGAERITAGEPVGARCS